MSENRVFEAGVAAGVSQARWLVHAAAMWRSWRALARTADPLGELMPGAEYDYAASRSGEHLGDAMNRVDDMVALGADRRDCRRLAEVPE
jgi:hypothetical protein